MTVICSKADDISVTEALKYLPEEAEAKQLHAHIRLLEPECKKLQEKLDILEQGETEAYGEIEQCLTYIGGLRSAIDDSADEDDVILFSPRASRKRPTREKTSKPSKRTRRQRDDDSEDSDSTLGDEPIVLEDGPEKEHISLKEAKWWLREAESHLNKLISKREELS